MLRNYLKSALRNFNRYRGYSLLNLAGLSLGLLAGLLIALWVGEELRVDRFHHDGDRIYQVMNNMGYGSEQVETWTGSPAPYYRILAEDLPEVEASLACFDADYAFERADGELFRRQGLIAAPNLFRFFSFPLAAGDAGAAFSAPQQVAISDGLAADLFGSGWRGDRTALGKTVQIRDLGEFTVTAVFEEIPEYSTLQFDYVLSLEDYYAMEPEARDHYGNFFYETFLRLADAADPELVGAKLAGVVNQHSGRDYAGGAIFLHPFEDRYLHSKFIDGRPDGGRIEYVRLFSAAALFILLIACINYMNLVTARSTRRAREVGIRKVSGATRRSLFGQFMTEAVLTTLLGAFIALAAAQLLLPAFNEITAKSIDIDYTSPLFWAVLLGLGVLTGLFSGSYPALALSSFRITNILKGEVVRGFNDLQLRRGLVILQFVLSITLLIGALVVRSQLQYLLNKDVGLDKNNVLMVTLPDALGEKYPLVKNSLLELPEVEQVTAGTENPLSVGISTGDPEWEGFSEDKRQIFNVLNVDHEFLETMRIPLVAGRDFDERMLRDTASLSYLINETAAAAMGLEEPVGKSLRFWGDEGRIVGVVRDFHFASLHEAIQPLILRLGNEWIGTILLRPAPGRTGEAIAGAEALIGKLAPDATFEYEFMDQSYAAMYRTEQTTRRLADLFALFALLISCLGLLGLTAFTTALRTREIGIRKVLGASVSNLVWLLNRELGLLLLVAFAVAAPLAWYLLRSWLDRFAYHVDFRWWVFAAAAALMLLVAVATVSYHSFRAANANPAKSLKYE